MGVLLVHASNRNHPDHPGTRSEGSELSDREVERLPSNLEIKSFATRDEQDVAGYAELMNLMFSSWQDIPFTGNHIRQLHQTLLRYSEKDTWHRGNYKTSSRSVAAFDETGAQIGIAFQTASPFDTPSLMTELVAWGSQEREAASLHPLLIIALCVVAFLEIHPFQDGNGRFSRVLTTLLLLQAGYACVPYSSLESVIEQGKEAYYLALRQTQGTIRTVSPNWQPWLVFFLRSLAEQVRRLEKKVERGTLNQHGRGRGVWYDLLAGCVNANEWRPGTCAMRGIKRADCCNLRGRYPSIAATHRDSAVGAA